MKLKAIAYSYGNYKTLSNEYKKYLDSITDYYYKLFPKEQASKSSISYQLLLLLYGDYQLRLKRVPYRNGFNSLWNIIVTNNLIAN